MQCSFVCCHVMPCHAMSCHVMWCTVMSCRVVSWHVMSCDVMWCHVMSCHGMAWRGVAWHVTSCGLQCTAMQSNACMSCMKWHEHVFFCIQNLTHTINICLSSFLSAYCTCKIPSGISRIEGRTCLDHSKHGQFSTLFWTSVSCLWMSKVLWVRFTYDYLCI